MRLMSRILVTFLPVHASIIVRLERKLARVRAHERAMRAFQSAPDLRFLQSRSKLIFEDNYHV